MRSICVDGSRLGSRLGTAVVLTGLAALSALWTAPAEAGSFAATNWQDYRQIRAEVEASHFLSKATFGPTKAEIASLAADIRSKGRKTAFEDWIDAEFAKPATLHRPLVDQMVADDGYAMDEADIWIGRYRDHAWWENAIRGDDQLRQRVAWALSQIVVTSDKGAGFNDRGLDRNGVPGWVGPTNYYDGLVNHAFGNYRDLLSEVTLSPIMGVYLSHLKNQKADPSIGRFPDENYAREVMQLFTIGTNLLSANGTTRYRGGNPIETYDNEDIKAFARVFTGLTYAGNPGFYGWRNFESPMEMYENFHDTDEKTLLRGTVLPAGQTGLDDVNGALDNLFDHPNCPPFIARRLIQRLVKSNPSKGYIYRVARVFRDNGQGVRGDMKAVVKAILCDRENINSIRRLRVRDVDGSLLGLEVVTRGTEYSSLREPVLRYTAMCRLFNVTSDYPTGRLMLSNSTRNMNQGPYDSPSVFNFYLPDFKPQGVLLNYEPSRRLPNRELFAPEFEIFTTVVANKMANQLDWDTSDGKIDRWVVNTNKTGLIEVDVFLDFAEETAIAETDDFDGLMAHLDLLLCTGTMSDRSREIIRDAILTEQYLGAENEAELAILLTLTSPDCAVEN